MLSASPVGPEFLVNGSTAGTQNDAAVAADGNGSFVTVWTSDHTGSREVI